MAVSYTKSMFLNLFTLDYPQFYFFQPSSNYKVAPMFAGSLGGWFQKLLSHLPERKKPKAFPQETKAD
jgi:hypothetical protein